MIGFYQRFIENYSISNIAAPLTDLMKHKQQFIWSKSCEIAFDKLKLALINSVYLAYHEADAPLVLIADASAVAIGSVLHQSVANKMEP